MGRTAGPVEAAATCGMGVEMLDCERRASRLIGLVLALTAAVLAVTPREARAASSTPPSIVFILTDDQDAGLVDTMPNLKSLVAAQGTTFNHAYYNVPLCSPSRATILTGQYTQNTGVFSNDHAGSTRTPTTSTRWPCGCTTPATARG